MAHAEVKQSKVNRTHLALLLLVAVLILSITRAHLVASMVRVPADAKYSIEAGARAR